MFQPMPSDMPVGICPTIPGCTVYVGGSICKGCATCGGANYTRDITNSTYPTCGRCPTIPGCTAYVGGNTCKGCATCGGTNYTLNSTVATYPSCGEDTTRSYRHSLGVLS
jgi:hypothetical protein